MLTESGKRWTVDPAAEYLTQGVYEFSVNNIALLFKKISIVNTMGQPTTNEQKTAFEITADCILAEEHGGYEIRAKVLGITIGRLERNMQFWTAHVPEEKRWEPKVIAELKVEIERVKSSDFANTYEQAKDNVLYGTWRMPNMMHHYIWLINRYPWDEVEPILHKWYEKFIVEDAVALTAHKPELPGM